MTWIDLSVLLQPRSRGFLSKKWKGREKALTSAGRFIFLIGCLKCNNLCNFCANVVKLNFILKMAVSKEATPTEIFPRNPVCMLCHL